MFVKKFKRKCSVRGCKNTANVFLVSKRREMGGTIGICTDCLKEATESIKAYTEPPKVVKEDKPLFPHPEIAVTTSSVAEVVPEPVEVIEDDKTEEQAVTEDSVTNEEAVISIIESKTEPQSKKKTSKKK